MAITVPWPTTTTEKAAAITALKGEISADLTDDQVNRLALMASAKIQQYAPRAPAASKEIALLRYVSYLIQMPNGALTKMSLGTVDLEFRPSQANAFVNSGAAAVITSFKRRRAGAIGGAKISSNTETPTASNPETRSMRQQYPNVDLTDTPVNIAAGLNVGTYEFQKSPGSLETTTVIYAFGPSAPADIDDYFILALNERIVFNTVTGCWLRVLIPGATATIAISSV